MTTYHFRPAVTSEAKPLIGLYAQSGRGKTYSALLLAKGFAGDMRKVGMIETESGRGEFFADDPIVGGYQVLPIRDDFSPKNYGEAITAAGKAGLQVLIIDSASHEWEGAGGVLSMAAKNQDEGKKGVLVWQKPKMDHQREFVLKLLSTPVSLVIVCMRAKFPMEEKEVRGKKEWVRSEELEPKQSEDMLFEMMVHAWIDKEHRLHPTKIPKNEVFQQIFVEGAPITVQTGQKLATWAAGRPVISDSGKSVTTSSSEPPGWRSTLWAQVQAAGFTQEQFASEFGSLKALPYERRGEVVAWLAKFSPEPQEEEDPFAFNDNSTSCRGCSGPLVNGKCHNEACPLGEPPENQ